MILFPWLVVVILKIFFVIALLVQCRLIRHCVNVFRDTVTSVMIQVIQSVELRQLGSLLQVESLHLKLRRAIKSKKIERQLTRTETLKQALRQNVIDEKDYDRLVQVENLEIFISC